MFRFRKFLPLLVAALVSVASTADAAFTLQIRVTSYDAAGNQTGQETSALTGPFPTPPGVGAATLMTTAVQTPNFDVTLTNNISNSNFLGNGVTSHTLTANINYSGPVENDTLPGTESDKLVVEFIGIGYLTPPVGNTEVISNASSSTGTLSASSVTFVSGVNNSNGGLPGTVGDTTGLEAGSITSQTGTLAPASLVLNVNPAYSGVFGLSTPFSFYQVMTFDRFTSTGNAAISAGSVVGVPAPAGVVLALVGMPVVGAFGWLRRRKTAETVSV